MTSPLPTLATVSIAATTSGGVGRKITSGGRSLDCAAGGCPAGDDVAGTASERAAASEHEALRRAIGELLLADSQSVSITTPRRMRPGRAGGPGVAWRCWRS